MRFVVDAQLPPALARMLAEQGHEAEHVYDFTKANASDGEIWQYALATTAVIVTKDEDFVIQASIASLAPPIVWIRTGNLGKQALLGWFQPLISQIVASIESGEKLIELA